MSVKQYSVKYSKTFAVFQIKENLDFYIQLYVEFNIYNFNLKFIFNLFLCIEKSNFVNYLLRFLVLSFIYYSFLAVLILYLLKTLKVIHFISLCVSLLMLATKLTLRGVTLLYSMNLLELTSFTVITGKGEVFLKNKCENLHKSITLKSNSRTNNNSTCTVSELNKQHINLYV